MNHNTPYLEEERAPGEASAWNGQPASSLEPTTSKEAPAKKWSRNSFIVLQQNSWGHPQTHEKHEEDIVLMVVKVTLMVSSGRAPGNTEYIP